MVKEKRILSYILGWLLLGYIILFIGANNVLADTYESFNVTWYYRNKSDESTLLNVVKNEETPLYASTNEYVNGYTTRIEKQFSKDMQYIINYNLRLFFSPEQELNYRSDTIQRIIDYSFVDSDFKILNVTANENWNRSTSSGDTALTIKVSMQVMALNNTDAIRFGVYTTNNISIGFYNHTSQIDYYLLSNININDNSDGTIIDQNNQIIQGQDDINQSIIDGNKETQEVIKDQFNSCRPSYNLFNGILEVGGLIGSNGLNDDSATDWRRSEYISINSNYVTISLSSVNGALFLFEYDEEKNFIKFSSNYSKDSTFKLENNTKYVRFTTSFIPSGNIQLVEGASPKPYEEYGKEVCSNRLDETNDKLDGIQGALTDTSTPNLEILGDSAGWLPAGPLDSVLNLPLTMMDNLLNSLGKTCSNLSVNLPYVNKKLEIPCIESLMEKMGAIVLWNWVGRIASVLILYSYLMNLYAWTDKILTLRAEFDEAMGADLANWGRL